MATIQKTTLKRYNGTDWDPVYLANSADITYLGKGFNVAAGEGFTVGQSIVATENIADVLETIINNLTAIDKTKIPALQAGSSITSVAADKLTGTVSRANLPEDVAGKGVEVISEDAKNALGASDVNVGDIVKVSDGKVYLVTASSEADGVTYMELSDSASEIAWARVSGTPTTLEGYGITDAVKANEKVTVANAENAGKILVLNAVGRLDVDISGNANTVGGYAADYFATAEAHNAVAERVTTAEGEIDTLQAEIKAIDASWITTGTIDIARLPASAIETLYVAADDAAIAALTTEQVQNGDTVKNAATGLMYFVVDQTKLGTADYKQGLVEYTAGAASSVDWSGILNKPTTLEGYGITDAVKSDVLVDEASVANAGKVVKVNAEGKLAASITGDADTVDGKHAEFFATATDMAAAQTAISNLQSAVGEGAEGLGGKVETLTTNVETLTTDMGTAKTDITNLKSGEAITALAASKLTGTVSRANLPADIAGRLFQKADLNEAMTSLTSDTAAVGDLVKTADGKVYVIVDAANLSAAEGYVCIVDYGHSVAWSQITGVPTTLAAMNWADAVTTAMLVDTATAANAGKVLKINDAGKLAADITGDAATVGGHAADYFATAEAHAALAGRMDTAEGEIDQLQTDIKAIDAAWITTGTISIDRLPHGALERCVVVADDAARFALTSAQVQQGDTVKVTGTGLMYFVVDDTKLGESAGYEVYTAGTASAVDWSGITNKPTTLAGYAITDAVAASEKVTEASAANAGKILVLNADGKLDVDITGEVEWDCVKNRPASTVAEIDAAVLTATHTNRAVLDKLGVDTDGHLTYNGSAVAYKAELDQVALGALTVTSDVSSLEAASGQLVLETIA